jgi:hypothetical protein
MTTIKVATVVVIAAVVVFTLPFAEGESISRGLPPAAALMWAVWWLAPLTLYWYWCRSIAGAAVIGAGYLAGAKMLLDAIYATESSTAAIGFATLPLLLWGGTLLALMVEWALITDWRARAQQR